MKEVSNVTFEELSPLDRKIIGELVEFSSSVGSGAKRRKRTPTQLKELFEESRVSISRRISSMRDSGILEKEKRGTENYYFVSEEFLEEAIIIAVKLEMMRRLSQLDREKAWTETSKNSESGYSFFWVLGGFPEEYPNQLEIELERDRYSLDELLQELYDTLKYDQRRILRKELEKVFDEFLDDVKDEESREALESRKNSIIEVLVGKKLRSNIESYEISSIEGERFEEHWTKFFADYEVDRERVEQLLNSLKETISNHSEIVLGATEGRKNPSKELKLPQD